MKIPLRFFYFILLLGFTSCSSTNGIDDYFTFNLQKSFTRNLAQDTSIQGLVYPAAIGIDSADCAKNGTSISLIKSVELTRLVLSTNFSAYPPASVIDSFILSAIDSTEQNTQLLASYSGSNDSVSLTNADFVSYLKNNLLKLRFRFHNVPQGFSYTGNYTLVITARPIQ